MTKDLSSLKIEAHKLKKLLDSSHLALQSAKEKRRECLKSISNYTEDEFNEAIHSLQEEIKWYSSSIPEFDSKLQKVLQRIKMINDAEMLGISL